MKFKDTPLKDLKVITNEPISDERGHFARCYCVEEFKNAGIDFQIVQRNHSFNHNKGTLRGMHWQKAPHAEAKLITCCLGSIFDVAVDMREDSPTYLKWFGIELTQRRQRMLYIPPGFAHGYQTLEDDVMVVYSVSAAYHPESSMGMRFDDPAVGIEWPTEVTMLSEKDQHWPLLQFDGTPS